MTIYRVDINQVQETMGAVVSSYVAPRTTKSSYFYASEEKAKKKQADIYDGIQKLAGYLPNIEVRITPVEVIE